MAGYDGNNRPQFLILIALSLRVCFIVEGKRRVDFFYCYHGQSLVVKTLGGVQRVWNSCPSGWSCDQYT